MHNLHVLGILALEVFGKEATMTMFGSLFGAEETAVVEVSYVITRVDGSFVHQVIENTFVFLPINLTGTVVAQQLFRRRKIRDVAVTDVADLLEEIR